jgi:hypothetical protein
MNFCFMGRRRRKQEVSRKRKRMSSGENLNTSNSSVESGAAYVPSASSASSASMELSASNAIKEEEFLSFFNINSSAIIEAISKHLNLEHLRDVEKRLTDQDEEIRELKEVNMHLRSRLKICEGMVAKNERAVQNISEKVVELQTRSMRDNILIKNMAEEAWEDDSKLEEKAKIFFNKS